METVFGLFLKIPAVHDFLIPVNSSSVPAFAVITLYTHLAVVFLLFVEHIIEIDSKSAMTSLHSSVMEETGRLGVNIFVDNGGICFTAFSSLLIGLLFKSNTIAWVKKGISLLC